MHAAELNMLMCDICGAGFYKQHNLEAHQARHVDDGGNFSEKIKVRSFGHEKGQSKTCAENEGGIQQASGTRDQTQQGTFSNEKANQDQRKSNPYPGAGKAAERKCPQTKD